MTGDLVTRVYGGFRGADFRGEECNLRRSPDCLNIWRDYKEADSIRTRPAMALQVEFPAQVYGVFFYNGTQLVHSGKNLYTVSSGGRKTIIHSGLQERRSNAFQYDGLWYFQDGKQYLSYDGSEIKPVEGYVPTTSIARKPGGGGTVYEDVNMLTGKRRNSFLADGESKAYHLDATELDEDFRPVVTVDGESVEDFTADFASGIITFTNAPPAPATDGQDNVVVEFRKTVPGHREAIEGCTLLQLFDNRVFFSGNEAHPNTLWHSSLQDPTYVSDLDYYREGLDSAPIRGLVAGNNVLWVFREPSDGGTTVFYHTPTLDSDYGKIYPSTHSSVSTGCVGRAINFGDDIVFFSRRGMEGISGDITTEQALSHRSSLVDRKLMAEEAYRDMMLQEWEGYLLVIIGSAVYLADSRAVFRSEGHLEYDWFYWELEQAITCAAVHDGILYLGTESGVYTLTDSQAPVESRWVTPRDKFGAPNMRKTTNKKGCVAEATGDVIISARTDQGDFETVGSFENVTDCIVARIKRKKFKDIQLKFHSDTRFSLETVTIQCFIGGYVK